MSRLSPVTRLGLLGIWMLLGLMSSVYAAEADSIFLDRSDRYLNVTGTFPLPGGSFKEELVVYFDAPIVVREVTGYKPIITQPALQGTIEIGSTYIVFKPKYPLEKRKYDLLLQDGIQSRDGKNLNPKHAKFSFSAAWGAEPTPTSKPTTPKPTATATPVPTLHLTQSGQVIGESGERFIDLTFTRPVEMSELTEHIRFVTEADGEEISNQPMTDGQSTQHRFQLFIEGEPVTVRVTVSKDLTAVNGEKLGREYTNAFAPLVRPLSVNHHYWYNEGRSGLALTMYLNQNIGAVANEEELKNHVEVTPPIKNLRAAMSSWSGETLQVFGDWMGNTDYQVKIKPGLKYGEKLVLQNEIVLSVRSETIEPFVGFGYAGKYYFPRRTGIALPMETRALQNVDLTLYRLFPNNLAASVRDMYEGKGSFEFNDRWCEQIGTAKKAVSGALHELIKTPLNMDELFPQDRRGVFCLAAASGYQQDTKLILYTDIGVLSHWRNDELVVFAHDLFSLEPKDGATVRVFSHKAQLMGEGTTDGHGMATFKGLQTSLGRPNMVVVEKDDDFTFLELENRPHNSSEVKPEMPTFNFNGYDAFVYADRDIYRPGETAHLRWIVRTHYGDALVNVPLLVTVNKPTGQPLLSEPITLSALGTGHLDLVTQKAYPTGNYQVQISVPGENTPLGTYTFKLEEFVPHRMKAEVVLNETIWLPGQEYNVTVNAKHLFGAPAVDRKSEARVVFKRGEFKPEGWTDFRFDNDSKYLPEKVSLGEEVTDASGTASFSFTYNPSNDVTFPMQAIVLGDVFELGGRAVTGRAISTFLPSEVMLGVAVTANGAEGGVTVHAAAIQSDGTAAEFPQVSVTLEREVWNYYVRRYYDSNEPNWTKSYQIVETRAVDMQNGRGATVFTTDRWGSYRVRVHHDSLPQYSTQTFYCYWKECNVGEATEPGLIKLMPDKEEYLPGDEALVRIESPFDGQGIVVVQGESIQSMFPVKITNGSGLARIPIHDEDFPNIWAEVTVVHEVKSDRPQVYPFSSFAIVNLNVRRPDRELVVTYPTLPEEIAPESRVVFDLNVTDHDGLPVQAEVTLAAVDEGIHGITNYSNPDPYGYLSRARQPDFRRAHYYDHVVYDFEKFAPGGDMGARVSGPPLQNWIKPVALWSGTVMTDNMGHVSITMDIPQYTGQLRLVAVANSDKAVGTAVQNVYVRKPYMMQVSVPRFMLPKDTMTGNLVLYNHSASPVKAEAQWSASGTLRQGSGSIVLDIPPQGETRYEATFAAEPLVGQGTVSWKAVIRDESGATLETLQQELPLPVYPPAAFQSRHDMIVLQPGESAKLQDRFFVPDSRNRMEMTVSANPAFRIQDALSYVIGYPYGCVEQTLSRLLPLYVLRQNQQLVEAALRDQKIDNYVRAGIDRLFAMQTPSGGLSMWPGGLDPYSYGSVYALHFLTQVKKDRAFELPKANYDALQNYVRGLLSDWGQNSQSDLYLRSYALYALAMDGDINAIQQIQRFDEIPVPKAARYLLAAALAMNTQDQEKVKGYLSKAPTVEYTIRELGYTLNSEIRNVAVELLALRQITGNEEQKAQLAETLIRYLESNRYGTTQETAFITTALGGYLTDIAADRDTASAEVESPTETVTIRGMENYSSRMSGEEIAYRVRNTGFTPLYVNMTTFGVPKEATHAAESKGMNVERTIYAGKEEHKGSFIQGDMYVVELNITANSELKNVVVDDLLPAGFEVENPRLDPSAVPDSSFAEAIVPSHLEIRDDRVVLAFNDLSQGEHHFYYIVRAVTPGRYQHPAVRGECMYDPTIYSISAAGTIEVK